MLRPISITLVMVSNGVWLKWFVWTNYIENCCGSVCLFIPMQYIHYSINLNFDRIKYVSTNWWRSQMLWLVYWFGWVWFSFQKRQSLSPHKYAIWKSFSHWFNVPFSRWWWCRCRWWWWWQWRMRYDALGVNKINKSENIQHMLDTNKSHALHCIDSHTFARFCWWLNNWVTSILKYIDRLVHY